MIELLVVIAIVGIGVGLGDGSVRLVNPAISSWTWRNAMLPKDGNPLGADWQE